MSALEQLGYQAANAAEQFRQLARAIDGAWCGDRPHRWRPRYRRRRPPRFYCSHCGRRRP